jgi:hypothetical protein
MAKSYFPREEFRKVFSEPAVKVLEQLVQLADTIERLGGVEVAVAAISEEQEDQNLSLASLDARLDVFEDFSATDPRYVRQDQTSAWTAATGTEARTALASYAGQTISNPPTQAEVQALDNAAKAASEHLVALINDLRSNGAIHE